MNTKKLASQGPQTKAIHSGEPNRYGVNGPIVTEIVRSSTFTFSNTEEMKEWAEGKNKAYIYTRYGNPTLSVAEKKIAALEGAEAAVVTASGMAAISSSLLAVLKGGDELISTAQLYGGTYRLLRRVWEDGGLSFTPVDLTDAAAVDAAWRNETRMVWVESPTNPRLEIVDIGAVAA